MKILIIEDDKVIARSLQKGLAADYAIELAYSGQNGTYQALANEYDLIILDLNLPDINGFAVCQDLRRANLVTPILVLSGKSITESKVVLLNAGADDYLIKPFSFNELKARLRALLRRGPKFSHMVLKVGSLSLHPQTKTVFFKQKPLHLAKKEFLLLQQLMRSPDVTQSRLQLIEHIWEGNPNINSNTVDVHICNLRNKIGSPLGNQIIKTIHGSGYLLDSSVFSSQP